MPTITEEERKSGTFDPHVPTPEDYAMYAKYSTVRLRLLAFFGDPVAKRILESR
jgi:hypothetical protein